MFWPQCCNLVKCCQLLDQTDEVDRAGRQAFATAHTRLHRGHPARALVGPRGFQHAAGADAHGAHDPEGHNRNRRHRQQLVVFLYFTISRG